MALDIDTCSKLLKRYGEVIAKIPEAEELYSKALWGLEDLGLTPEEVERIRISVIADLSQRRLAERLWVNNPPHGRRVKLGAFSQSRRRRGRTNIKDYGCIVKRLKIAYTETFTL